MEAYNSVQQKKLIIFEVAQSRYSKIMGFCSLFVLSLYVVVINHIPNTTQDQISGLFSQNIHFTIMILNVVCSVLGNIILSAFSFLRRVHLVFRGNQVHANISIQNCVCCLILRFSVILIIMFTWYISCVYVCTDITNDYSMENVISVLEILSGISLGSIIGILLDSNTNVKCELCVFVIIYLILLCYVIFSLWFFLSVPRNDLLQPSNMRYPTQTLIIFMFILNCVQHTSSAHVMSINIWILLKANPTSKNFFNWMSLSHIIGVFISFYTIGYQEEQIFIVFSMSLLAILIVNILCRGIGEMEICWYTLIFSLSIAPVTWSIVGNSLTPEWKETTYKIIFFINWFCNLLAVSTRALQS